MPGVTERLALLVFRLEDRRFGLFATAVHEILRAVAIAPLPRAPAIVEGVFNLRGTLVPVLDVRHRFGVPPRPLHPDQHFIVATAGRRTVALRVDRADELIAVEPDRLEPPAVVPGARFVAGIARLDEGLVVIHDLESFLSLDEADGVERALGAAAAAPPGGAGG